MSEERKEQGTVNCGCGCFGCLAAIVSLILMCWIGGCGWARGVVIRCIGDISTAMAGEKK